VAESQAKKGKCCRLPLVGPNFNVWQQQIDSRKQHRPRNVADRPHWMMRFFVVMMPESNISPG